MPKFRINIRFWFVLILGFILTLSFVINVFFLTIKKQIAVEISEPLIHRLIIKNIFYIFPDRFLVQDLRILPKDTSIIDQSIVVPLLALKLSLRELIGKRHLIITTFVLDKMRSSQNSFSKFLSDNAVYLIALLQELPKMDITFLIKEASIDSPPEKLHLSPTTFNLAVFIKKGDFWANGAFYSGIDSSPLQLAIRGNLTSKGLYLNQGTFYKHNMYSNFWGELKGPIFQLNGYAFLNNQTLRYSNLLLDTLLRRPPRPHVTKTLEPSIDIINVDCRGRLGFPRVQIENLNFILNDFPIRIKGTAIFSTPMAFNFTASLDNAPAGPNRIKDFKQLNLNFSGLLTEKTLKGRGGLSVIFKQSKDSSFLLDKIEMNSPKTSFFYDQFKRPTLQLHGGGISILTNEDHHRLSFKTLKASFHSQTEKFKIIKLMATMYKGYLKGRFWYDVSHLPPSVIGSAVFKDVEAHALAELLIYFSKIYGKASGKINFKSHPNFQLYGFILIQNGYLKNFDFFKWIAETFNIPSLTDIRFVQAQTQFWLHPKGRGLTNIKITSKDVGLTGFLNLDKNSLIASKISLLLSRKTLQESPKFRAILTMFEEAVPSLTFDFQLSGPQKAINFLWLQSEFKQHIQNRIPNFVERMIDRKIDAILEGKIPEESESSSQ